MCLNILYYYVELLNLHGYIKTQNLTKMKKITYYLTIVVRESNTVHHLERDSETIDATIRKELGGWGNLRAASTGNSTEYFQAGTTYDNSKVFSILCVESKVN